MFASSESERMRFYGVVLVLALFATTLSSAIPKPADDNDDHKAKHVVDKELSDEKHYEGDEHNTDYDHEAFLGKEESKTFDQLTPEESKERLGFLVTKIDKDGDGSVTEEELKDWIKHVQHRYIYKDTERQWKEHEATGDTLEWKTYHTRTYGFLNENDDDQNSYKDMIKRDERRWKKADGDGDGKLTKEEFAHFLHPEEAKHMQDIVVEETLEDIDKDKDGFISLEEYIGDFMEDEEDDDDDEDKEKREEPDWIKTERDVFKDQHDKNQDGNLDREEVRAWIIPDDYDHIESEAKHLLQNADIDKDGKLSKDEILEKYDVFVGSQATDFGEALTSHDEF